MVRIECSAQVEKEASAGKLHGRDRELCGERIVRVNYVRARPLDDASNFTCVPQVAKQPPERIFFEALRSALRDYMNFESEASPFLRPGTVSISDNDWSMVPEPSDNQADAGNSTVGRRIGLEEDEEYRRQAHG